ncbi:MAG: NUMOD3 domain-containing DNA-binding protein [Paenisporosarcina sp.]
MKDKLDDVRTILEDGVYKGHKFTEESKRKVRNSIKGKNNNWFPNFLTVAVALGFVGFGFFFVTQELGLFEKESLQASVENKNNEPTIIEPIDLNGDLPEDLPLIVNEDLLENLSLPIDIQNVIPKISSKPQIYARTVSDGYQISLTYYGDKFAVNMIENVDLPKNIEEYKRTRNKIWTDEETLVIKGHDAYYSVDQKEMHLFTKEKYFILHGAEEEQLLEIANMVDTEKPVQKINLVKYEEVMMESAELSEIQQPILLPLDLNEKVEFLKDTKSPVVTARKNDTAFEAMIGYSSPIDTLDIFVTQRYSQNGNQHIIQQIQRDYTLEKEVEINNRKIFLYSNGFHHKAYFTHHNNLFTVDGVISSIPIESIEEILAAIEIE